MKLKDVLEMPTTFKNEAGGLCSESLLRSHALVQHLRKMCEMKIPHEYMLELMDFVEHYTPRAKLLFDPGRPKGGIISTNILDELHRRGEEEV